MSLSYAELLSFREDVGGTLGAPELSESSTDLDGKLQALTALVRGCKHLVVFTGAGISTASGIPDFRGPQGIWTLQKEGRPIPRATTSLEQAVPTYTHMALKALSDRGMLSYLSSQNVDGLHLRSGIARHLLAELHGNCFAERCASCGFEYVRDFELRSVGFRATSRRCTIPTCRGRLHDQCLDWDNALPEAELKRTESEMRKADLVLCLGTSLQIRPACYLPLRCLRNGGRLVIVNLQKTPMDRKAHLVIHAKADEVMHFIMTQLAIPVPRFYRTHILDLVLRWRESQPRQVGRARCPLRAQCRGASADDEEHSSLNLSSLTLFVQSEHGPKCPMPYLDSVEVQFDGSKLQGGTLREPKWALCRKQAIASAGQLSVRLKLMLKQTYQRKCAQVEGVFNLYNARSCAKGEVRKRVGYHSAFSIHVWWINPLMTMFQTALVVRV
mmetsp:Transcript_10585/g.38917  ORF Transcript_10585/g.38917 Transcript_10585/m.38917 type:complete len:443 (+) Transcript_10585:219-1547(+)